MDTIIPSDVIRVGQIEIWFRLVAAQTGGTVSVFEYRIPAKARVPVPHSHVAFDETLYGLEGACVVTVDARKVLNGPGDVLFITRGVVHHIENLGDVDARGLSVVTPGLLGPDFFREMAGVVNLGGPPDVQRIAAIMRRHGMRPVPPVA